MWYLQQFVNIVNNFTTFSKETTLKLSRLTKTISDNRCTTIAVVPYTDNYSKLNFLLRHCKCRPAECIMFTLCDVLNKLAGDSIWVFWSKPMTKCVFSTLYKPYFVNLNFEDIHFISVRSNEWHIYQFFNPALRCYNKFILFLIETNTCVYSSFSRVTESPKGNHLL